jgi:hypothetical protein
MDCSMAYFLPCIICTICYPFNKGNTFFAHGSITVFLLLRCIKFFKFCNNIRGTNSFLKHVVFNPLKAELNPICYLLALLAHRFLHVSRIRVKSLTLRLLMSYIYIYIYIYMERLFLMFLDHTRRRSTVGRTPLDE